MAAPLPSWTPAGCAPTSTVRGDVRRAVLVADRGRLADLRLLAVRRRPSLTAPAP